MNVWRILKPLVYWHHKLKTKDKVKTCQWNSNLWHLNKNDSMNMLLFLFLHRFKAVMPWSNRTSTIENIANDWETRSVASHLFLKIVMWIVAEWMREMNHIFTRCRLYYACTYWRLINGLLRNKQNKHSCYVLRLTELQNFLVLHISIISNQKYVVEVNVNRSYKYFAQCIYLYMKVLCTSVNRKWWPAMCVRTLVYKINTSKINYVLGNVTPIFVGCLMLTYTWLILVDMDVYIEHWPRFYLQHCETHYNKYVGERSQWVNFPIYLHSAQRPLAHPKKAFTEFVQNLNKKWWMLFSLIPTDQHMKLKYHH